MEEPFLPEPVGAEPVGARPVGGLTAIPADRSPFAINLIRADAIWSGVALVVTERDDAAVAGWSFEKTNPSEANLLSWPEKRTLLEETTSPDEGGVSGAGSGSGIGAASRRLIRSIKPPPAITPCGSVFGGGAAGLG
jgi:hypothetical protein